MTKDDIAKLPTPETDALLNETMVLSLSESWHMLRDKSRSLEQRLAAAVMALEGMLTPSMVHHRHGWPEVLQARETLAAIRGDK